jgi:hypothetical protein
MRDLRSFALPIACAAAAATALSFTGCGPAKAPGPPPAPTAAPASTGDAAFDPCSKSGPVPHPYTGILRVARCEQDMFLTMASVAGQLGVECEYCHVPRKDNPKKDDYPVMTPHKEIANWMSMHLMQAIKPADGSTIKCKSCHTDENGKPVAKILGNPRDPGKAMEWMTLVMVNRFVAADGTKLKCKSCHVGNVGTAEWQPKVILQSAQIPKHEAGGKGPAL